MKTFFAGLAVCALGANAECNGLPPWMYLVGNGFDVSKMSSFPNNKQELQTNPVLQLTCTEGKFWIDPFGNKYNIPDQFGQPTMEPGSVTTVDSFTANAAGTLSEGAWAQWSTQQCGMFGIECSSQSQSFSEHFEEMYEAHAAIAVAQSVSDAYALEFADPDVTNTTRYNLTNDAWELLLKIGTEYNASTRAAVEAFIAFGGGNLMAKTAWGGILKEVCAVTASAFGENGAESTTKQMSIKFLNDVFSGGGGGSHQEQAAWWSSSSTCVQSVGGGAGGFGDI